MAAIPNPATDVHYDGWIRLGYAVFNATGGAPEGFDIWDGWSGKSDKYDAGETEAAWKRIGAAISGTDAPRKVGAGSIIMQAKAAGWGKTVEDPDREPPPEITDPGYIAAIEGSIDLDLVEAVVAEFNRKYFVVMDAGKAMIFAPAHDPILTRRYHHRLDFADLQKLYLNRTVKNGVDKKASRFHTGSAGMATPPEPPSIHRRRDVRPERQSR
jgi:hypothetical protein